ncbi:hypothetical protein EV714DRAFT_253745 [Schizophyllum commune]
MGCCTAWAPFITGLESIGQPWLSSAQSPVSLPTSGDLFRSMVVQRAHDALCAARATVIQCLHTGYLFSKSDVVPILGPVLCMSTVLVGPTDPLAFLEGFVWVELHLMAFETKNQVRLRSFFPPQFPP